MAAALVIPHIAGYDFDVSPDLSNPATRERLSPSAIKGFLRVMEKWEIKDPDARQLLGGLSSGSYYGSRKSRSTERLIRTRLHASLCCWGSSRH